MHKSRLNFHFHSLAFSIICLRKRTAFSFRMGRWCVIHCGISLAFFMIKEERKDDDEEKPEKVNNGHKKNFITSTFLSSVV